MKRFPFVLGATAAGLATVLTYHSQAGETALPAAAPAAAGAGHSSAPQSKAGHGTGAQSGAGQNGSTAPSHASHSTATTTPGAVATTPKRTTTTAPATQSTATGTLEQYGYGVLSVRVTASGSKITDVAVAKLQTADPYSQQLAAQVIPMLRREVLAKQTARIYGVSGATYTSEAYATSLQAALDKLHIP